MKQLQIFAVFGLSLISVSACAGSLSLSEFLKGERSSYTTKGDPKAKGIEVSFEHPNSWKGMSGKRPHVVYQVTSENGAGLELCNLMIKDIPAPPGYVPSANDVNEIFSPEGIRDMVPPDGLFIAGDRTSIDGQPSGWVHFEQKMNRAGREIQMSWIMYATFTSEKLILFSCSVGDGAEKAKEDIRRRYKENFPLFQQMANSIVIHTKWNSPAQ